MEYSKESEKFAFGFGTDKMAGSGKVTELVSVKKKKEKSEKQEIAEVALSAAAVVGITIFKLISGKKKKKKNGRKR